MKKLFLIFGLIFSMGIPVMAAGTAVAESQFKLLDAGSFDFGTAFNYRSTKYTGSDGNSRTLSGLEQFFYVRLGLWQDLTIQLDTSYLDLQSQENQITTTGTRVYERTQTGLTNVNLGALYRHDLDVVQMFYGLTLSMRPEEKQTELSRNAEKSNAVSRQNAVIPMVGVAVPLGELFVIGAKGSLYLQQSSKGKVTDKTVNPETVATDTYKDGNIVTATVFGEVNMFLHPFVSYERGWYYSTLVSREGGTDYRIAGGKSESVSVGVELPLFAISLLPTYTFTKYSPDDSTADTQESSYLSVGARIYF